MMGSASRLKQFWKNTETREYGLVIFTGLVVAWVRHGLHYHWTAWATWEGFFVDWFIHTLGVGVLATAAAAAIIFSHTFFLGYVRKEYGRELFFYIVMTILIGALGIAVISLRLGSGNYDDSRAILNFIC
jgi:hypothetical protein